MAYRFTRFASLMVSAPARRGSKHLDWYTRALERQAARDNSEPLSVFPEEVLHGKERAKAFIDVVIGANEPKRIEFELADDIVPQTVENFLNLCEGSDQKSYVGSKFFRVAKGFGVFFGDYINNDGTGSASSFDERYFKDENFVCSEPGVLTMANHGIDTNGSVCFITLDKAPHLDGRHVAFGRVTKGMDALEQMADVFTVRGKPAVDVVIKAAGKL